MNKGKSTSIFLTGAFSFCLGVFVFAFCTGCGESAGPGSKSHDPGLVKSDKYRITDPSINEQDKTMLVKDNNSFALDFFQEVCRNADSNVFVSPYSISLALAMTYAGARGETEKEMADAMHFGLGQEGLHPAFDWLDLELQSRADPPDENADDGFKLRITNAVWGQAGYRFLDPFLDILAQYYGAGLRVCDFTADPEACRKTINSWVADQTEDKIKDLLPAGALSTVTRMVLVNAIYFKAAWNSPFEVEDTKDGEFTLLDGEKVEVAMMYQEESFGFSQGDGYKAVELPYDGEQLSMVIIVPDQGEFESFEQGLDQERLEAILKKMSLYSLKLHLPKFSFDFGGSIKDTLEALGMATAFSPVSADFSGITDVERLFISDVIHKAFVAVDEAGTEAAAATAVVMDGFGVPDDIELTIDRPFIFLIRDIPTGTVLFIGRVLDPTA